MRVVDADFNNVTADGVLKLYGDHSLRVGDSVLARDVGDETYVVGLVQGESPEGATLLIVDWRQLDGHNRLAPPAAIGLRIGQTQGSALSVSGEASALRVAG